jgi:BioD-like phosphotransacetylase family protein
VAVLIVASSEPRVGRSLVAAAVAYRAGRDGRAVSLVRIDGDASASGDAAVFAGLEGVTAPDRPVAASALASISGDIIAEAPAGPTDALVAQLSGARVLSVAIPTSPGSSQASAGTILTRVPAAEVTSTSQQKGVAAILPEDSVLAAPSASDIAGAIEGRWLAQPASGVSVGRVMIGTVASDAAAPYFDNRRSTCIVTRFDKTDIQLAALNTDVECLVLTGGGEPSPYLLDRIAGHRPDVAVVVTDGSTVETVRRMEPLFAASRFDGQTKLLRAVELLDVAGATIDW